MSIRHGQFGNFPPSNESWMNGDWREVYYSNANQPFWTSNGIDERGHNQVGTNWWSPLVSCVIHVMSLVVCLWGLNISSCICRRYLSRFHDFVPPIDWFRRLFGGRGRESIKRFSQKWWVAYWLDYVKGSDHGGCVVRTRNGHACLASQTRKSGRFFLADLTRRWAPSLQGIRICA